MKMISSSALTHRVYTDLQANHQLSVTNSVVHVLIHYWREQHYIWRTTKREVHGTFKSQTGEGTQGSLATR